MTSYIATDARWVGNHGIGRYAAEVLRRLTNTKALAIGGKPSSPLDPIRLSLALRQELPKVFYNPGFNCPVQYFPESVLTIHDLIHLADKDQRSIAKELYYERLLKPFLKKSPFVFTVSELSKGEILTWAKLEPSKVIVTPNGVSTVFTAPPQKIKEKNFLYVGSSRSHKNTKRMLEAFALLKDTELKLGWVGSISKEDRTLAKKLNLENRLSFYSNLSNEQLASLYQRAIGTILVSTLEGFGLPPIESIFCGTPALISNNSPLAEDLKTLSISVEPENIDSILDGLERLQDRIFTNHDYAKIAELKSKYNWDNTAAIVQANLNRLL